MARAARRARSDRCQPVQSRGRSCGLYGSCGIDSVWTRRSRTEGTVQTARTVHVRIKTRQREAPRWHCQARLIWIIRQSAFRGSVLWCGMLMVIGSIATTRLHRHQPHFSSEKWADLISRKCASVWRRGFRASNQTSSGLRDTPASALSLSHPHPSIRAILQSSRFERHLPTGSCQRWRSNRAQRSAETLVSTSWDRARPMPRPTSLGSTTPIAC
jgi:hypothetical protein